MQKRSPFLLLLILLTLPALAQPADPDSNRDQDPAAIELIHSYADSMFAARQYTQALEAYTKVRNGGYGSPSMFLKMAYIQEGLGHLGESLYYLNLYAISSHDPQAANKMTELAEKNNLEGYQEQPFETFRTPLREYFMPIAGALSALSLLIVALLVNRARQKLSPSLPLSILLLLFISALYFHVNYGRNSSFAIVTRGQTYLMAGPSAGAPVVGIIGEGHRLHIKGQHDAWLRVEWREGEVFVRDFLVRKIEL